MERLSGLDASLLYFESPANHLHVSSVMTFDPSTVPGGYAFARIKETVAAQRSSRSRTEARGGRRPSGTGRGTS
jgi:diacylglycerol O-acyltransferase